MPIYFLYHVRGWSGEVHSYVLYLKLPEMYLYLILLTQIEGLREHHMDAISYLIIV